MELSTLKKVNADLFIHNIAVCAQGDKVEQDWFYAIQYNEYVGKHNIYIYIIYTHTMCNMEGTDGGLPAAAELKSP